MTDFQWDSPAPFSEQAEVSVQINYSGTKQVCDILFPILRPHSRYAIHNAFVMKILHISFRVVSVSSRGGHLGNFGSDLKAKFVSNKLTVSELDEIMTEFVRSVLIDRSDQLVL